MKQKYSVYCFKSIKNTDKEEMEVNDQITIKTTNTGGGGGGGGVWRANNSQVSQTNPASGGGGCKIAH
jgi:hypothetical protein